MFGQANDRQRVPSILIFECIMTGEATRGAGQEGAVQEAAGQGWPRNWLAPNGSSHYTHTVHSGTNGQPAKAKSVLHSADALQEICCTSVDYLQLDFILGNLPISPTVSATLKVLLSVPGKGTVRKKTKKKNTKNHWATE